MLSYRMSLNNDILWTVSTIFSDISNNAVQEIPDGSFYDTQTATTELDVSNNVIDTIQAGVFEKLANLETL